MVTVRVSGVGPVLAALRGLVADFADLDAYRQIADRAATEIRGATPRRSGRLAAGVQPVKARGEAVVRNSVPYAGAINYGWPSRKIPAARYMQAADSDSQLSASVRLLEHDIDQQIRHRGLSR